MIDNKFNAASKLTMLAMTSPSDFEMKKSMGRVLTNYLISHKESGVNICFQRDDENSTISINKHNSKTLSFVKAEDMMTLIELIDNSSANDHERKMVERDDKLLQELLTSYNK